MLTAESAKRLIARDDEQYGEIISILDEIGYHGFIFNDGSILELGDVDHRMLDINLWGINHVISYHHNMGSITFRTFGKISRSQEKTLEGLSIAHKRRDILLMEYSTGHVFIRNSKYISINNMLLTLSLEE